MKTVQIHIVTVTNGERQVFAAQGTLESSGQDIFVRYPIDGDTAYLRSDGRYLSMERRGDISLTSRFAMGETTSMTTAHGGYHGELPLHTNFISLTSIDYGYFIKLEYDLLFATDSAHFNLEITIKALEEK